MKRNFNKLDNLEEPDNQVRTGVLKSATIIEENRPHGRRDKWTKDVYIELEEAEKKGKEKSSTFQKAGQ